MERVKNNPLPHSRSLLPAYWNNINVKKNTWIAYKILSFIIINIIYTSLLPVLPFQHLTLIEEAQLTYFNFHFLFTLYFIPPLFSHYLLTLLLLLTDSFSFKTQPVSYPSLIQQPRCGEAKQERLLKLLCISVHWRQCCWEMIV